jgi:hypothetical protein
MSTTHAANQTTPHDAAENPTPATLEIDEASKTRQPAPAGHLDHEERSDGGRGRRWYHLRPEPRRRTDLMGFNSAWWMAVGWLIVILLVIFPFPWWS